MSSLDTRDRSQDPDDPRDESKAERDDRNLAELLQELRVAGLGVQVLFGFLLSIPFTSKFSDLSHGQRQLYIATLVLAAVATALLLGPVAYHRIVFRQQQKERLVRAANVMAIAGLAAVGLAVSAAILLVTGYVDHGLPSVLITVFTACLFAGLWFALPLASRAGRRRGERADPQTPRAPARMPPPADPGGPAAHGS
jgi:ABC-type Fe3+ transport system permease subunit